MTQYERGHVEFSCFTLDQIDKGTRKVDRFLEGLHKDIKGLIAFGRLTTYAAVVMSAMILDRDVPRLE